MKLYLIDASGFLFRAYFALPPISNAQGVATHALFGFVRSLFKLLKQEQPTHLVSVYDGPNHKQSRKALYPDYKANRTAHYEDLPEQIEASKQFCTYMGIPYLDLPGVEADDTIAALTHWAEQQGMDVRICSADKDLYQLVNDTTWLLHPWKEYQIIREQEVQEKFGVRPSQIPDYLGLVGDASDHIPGVKGIGPKTAQALLTQFPDVETILDHISEISSKKTQTLLCNQQEQARVSKQLALLDYQTPLPIPEDHFTLKPPIQDSLRAFYFSYGFLSLLKAEQRSMQTPPTVHCLRDPLEVQRFFQECHGGEPIPIVIHRTASHQPVAIAILIPGRSPTYIPCLDDLLPMIWEGISSAAIRWVGHHTKEMSRSIPLPYRDMCAWGFDTLVAAYLLDPSSQEYSFPGLVLQRLGQYRNPWKEGIEGPLAIDHPSTPPLASYLAEEVNALHALYKSLSQELHEANLDPLFYELELPLTRIIRKMEERGIYLDVAQLESLLPPLRTQLHSLEQEIYQLAGCTFNINSPKQLSEILFEQLNLPPIQKTSTGYSTRADVLEKLAVDHPIAERILAYRSLEKMRSTYLEALPKQVNPTSHRIHPTFDQYGTTTGRLACHHPNLQNIPVRHGLGAAIRSAFRPMDTGWSFLSADYSQIELRLLAHLSGDPHLLAAFKKGEDIHRHTASLLFGTDDVTEEQRHRAKAINFGIVYGQQAFGLAKELHITPKAAQEFIDAYYQRYPNVWEYQQRSIRTVQDTGYTTTLLGRRRAIPDIHSRNTHLRAAAERLAINTPLQGSAADLIKMAMLQIDQILSDQQLQSFLILQIHDELIFETRDEELDRMQLLVQETMERVLTLEVPLLVHLSIGKNWGEC